METVQCLDYLAAGICISTRTYATGLAPTRHSLSQNKLIKDDGNVSEDERDCRDSDNFFAELSSSSHRMSVRTAPIRLTIFVFTLSSGLYTCPDASYGLWYTF